MRERKRIRASLSCWCCNTGSVAMLIHLVYSAFHFRHFFLQPYLLRCRRYHTRIRTYSLTVQTNRFVRPFLNSIGGVNLRSIHRSSPFALCVRFIFIVLCVPIVSAPTDRWLGVWHINGVHLWHTNNKENGIGMVEDQA